MKKTKLFSALALASCVMLSGCEKKQQSGTPSLSVADLPHLVAGVEFDVSSFVTAQGGSGAVSITLDAASQANASLDSTSTKITALHSGEVKFTVHYEDLAVDCTVAVDSKEYLLFAEATKDPLTEYSSESYYYDAEADELVLDEGYYYSKDLYTEYYDEEYSGFVEYDEKVYSFDFIPAESELEEDVLNFKVTGEEPEELSDYCVEFPIPASSGVCKYVPAEEDTLNTTPTGYECISFSSKKTREAAAEVLFGVNPQVLTYYGISIVEAQVLPEEFVVEGETFVEYYCALFLRGPEAMFYKDGGEDIVTVSWGAYLELEESLLNAYIKGILPEEAPQGADASEFFDVVGPKLMGHNFTVSYTFGWYDAEFNPLEANPFYDPTNPAIGTMIDDYLNATGSIVSFVTENQTLVTNAVGESFAAKGLVNHDGDVYSYSWDAETSTCPAVLIAEETEIFKNEELAADPSTHSYLLGLSDVFVNSYENGVLEFSFGSALDVLHGLFVSSVPEAIKWAQVSTYLEFVNLAFDLGNMMYILEEEPFMAAQQVNVQYVEAMDAVILSVVIPEELENGTPVYYALSVMISDFGTTVIPAWAEPAYPAAA
jgi:hypothetical protein